MTKIEVNTYETEKALIAIGQSIIDRAKDISNDLDKVNSITIHAELNPAEITTFDITKNYIATLTERG